MCKDRLGELVLFSLQKKIEWENLIWVFDHSSHGSTEDEARLFLEVYEGSIRGNRQSAARKKQLDMKKIFFTAKVSKLENWLLKEVIEFLSLEILKIWMKKAL